MVNLKLSIVSLSTSLTADYSIVLPKNIIKTSLITSQHYIAIATPKTITVFSPTLSVIATLNTPVPTITGSARWLIYPTHRPNPQLPRSQILDTPPETRLVERVARGLTKEVVSWGRETGEKIGGALYSYLNGPTVPSPSTPEKVVPMGGGSTSRTTLIVHDIPTNTVLTQFQVPIKAGFISVSRSGTMLFCSSPKGDEFFVYSLSHIPIAVHLVATFSRGYTYSRVIDVIWRGDNGCMGVISARGTGHVFSLKRRGKETARAVGKVKIEGGGVKGMMFIRRGGTQSQVRRRSSTTKDEAVDILTVATTHERVTSWKLAPAQRSTIGLLTAYFNPPTTQEPQSIPVATPIADYILPSKHQDISFSTLISSPALKAAFTNQRDSTIDCTAKAEVECSLSTRGVTGIRGIRLFEYTFPTSTPLDTDFGTTLPWTTKEIDLGMPRGEVRYFGGAADSSSGSPRSLETPPSSEQESPSLTPETGGKKKRRNRPTGTTGTVTKDTGVGIEKAISASLGTELDKTRMTTVPPTPPGSFSTPKVQPSEWVGDILDRGKTIVRNVGRRSSTAVRGVQRGDEDVCFEDGVEVLSLEDAPAVELDGSESADSDESGHQGKVRGETSVVGGEMMDQWDI